jgi:GntR family transcriptional regulator
MRSDRTIPVSDDTKIDHEGSRCVYEQVVDAIAARIASGYYPVKLPSERALAEEFGVSYITVRHVTAILRERGLIVSVHGRGTFVSESARSSR